MVFSRCDSWTVHNSSPGRVSHWSVWGDGAAVESVPVPVPIPVPAFSFKFTLTFAFAFVFIGVWVGPLVSLLFARRAEIKLIINYKLHKTEVGKYLKIMKGKRMEKRIERVINKLNKILRNHQIKKTHILEQIKKSWEQDWGTINKLWVTC